PEGGSPAPARSLSTGPTTAAARSGQQARTSCRVEWGEGQEWSRAGTLPCPRPWLTSPDGRPTVSWFHGPKRTLLPRLRAPLGVLGMRGRPAGTRSPATDGGVN